MVEIYRPGETIHVGRQPRGAYFRKDDWRSFLLRDDFITQWLNFLASPRTAEPGPGTLTLTQTGGNFSILNGEAVIPANSNGTDGTTVRMWATSSFARTIGLAFFFEATVTANSAANISPWWGWFSSTPSSSTDVYAYRAFQGTFGIEIGKPDSIGGAAYTLGVAYGYGIVCRTSGALFFSKVGGNWILDYVSDLLSTSPLYAGVMSRNTLATGKTDSWRVLNLPAPFDTDYGLATDRKAGSVAAGTTFVHEANCVIEWTQTTIPSGGGATRIRFRLQDASNFWQVNVLETGQLDLYEVVATVPTSRGTVAGGTVAAGHRIVVVCDGTTIRVYSNNVLRITYSSANNFATETDGLRNILSGTENGTVSDLITWPRVISGVAATLLDDAANGVASTYLLNDEFTTREGGAVPSPRSAEPTGTLTLVQNDGLFSISNGKLNFPAQSTPAWGDQGFYETAGRSRAAGLGLVAKFNKADTTTLTTPVAWSSAASASPTGGTVSRLAFEASGIIWGGNQNIANYAAATDYQLALVLRASGCFGFIRGGVFTQWTLLWVWSSETFATAYPMFANYSGSGTLDTFRVINLPTPFNDNYDIATQRLAGARSASDTFTHEANCVIEWTQTTLPSGDATRVRFRKASANEFWYIRTNAAGDIELYEATSGGTGTVRGSSAAVVSNGHRIVVVADGSTIRVYSNNVLRFTYSSASNFATATTGEVYTLGTGGAVSDIVSWPRTLTGAAAAILDAAVA